MITGSVAGADEGRETFAAPTTPQGRALTAADEGANVDRPRLGHRPQVRQARSATRSTSGASRSTVVGILEPTLTAPDQAAIGAPRGRPAAVRRDAAADRRGRGSTPSDLVDLDDRLPERRRRPRGARRPDRGAGARRRHHDRQGLRPADRLGDLDPQLDPRRDRPDQPRRRRPVGHQHDGHVDRRADPRDRHQARHRRRPLPDRPRARHRVGAHRLHRRRRSGSSSGAVVVIARQRGGPLVRARSCSS